MPRWRKKSIDARRKRREGRKRKHREKILDEEETSRVDEPTYEDGLEPLEELETDDKGKFIHIWIRKNWIFISKTSLKRLMTHDSRLTTHVEGIYFFTATLSSPLQSTQLLEESKI